MANFRELVELDVEILGLNRDTYAGSEIFQGSKRCRVCFKTYFRQSWTYTGKSGQEVNVCERCHTTAQKFPKRALATL